MSATATNFPYRTADPGLGIGAVFTKGSVMTLLGLVTHLDEGWARRVRVRLHSSLGPLFVEAHLDQLPEDVLVGEWVRLRVMRRHGEGETPLKLMRATRYDPPCKAAWLPSSLCHRTAHAERLRKLLRVLEPSLQMVFMLAVSDPQVQRRLFWRVGAADHHGYPGGVFDQSVEAAEVAWMGGDEDPHVHGLAAMAALLFDFGKVGDEALTPDRPRSVGPLERLAPHRLTTRRLERAIERVRQVDSTRMDELQAVLCAESPDVPLTPQLRRAALIARQAVWQTWAERDGPMDIHKGGTTT